MSDSRALVLTLTASIVTIVLRFLPFWLFGKGRETPPLILYLGRVLPYAIMGMLVVFCLRNVSISAAPHGLPELIACACIVLTHLWKRNTILSILAGTVIYMLLVQKVF